MERNYRLYRFYGCQIVNLAAKAADFTDICIIRNEVAKLYDLNGIL